MGVVFGKDRIAYDFVFDNHSPTCINPGLIANNSSIRKSTYQYTTSTADGVRVSGNVYSCDSVGVGDAVFDDVLCYSINPPPGVSNAAFQGIFGHDLISLGVWKIDFKNNLLTFASHIDSIDGVTNAQRLPVTFSDNNVNVEVTFLNGVSKTLQIDLGFNWGVLLPPEEFRDVNNVGMVHYQDSLLFTTPGRSEMVLSSEAFAKLRIGSDTFQTQVSSNPEVAECLLGLQFFMQFEYIVLDYINEAVYISKTRLFK